MRNALAKGLSICVCILALGLFIECAQWFIGRGFSPLDLLRNLIGVCVGGTLYIAWISTAPRKLTALTVAGLLLIVSFLPTAAFIYSGTLAPMPPTLVDFEQWGVTHRIRSTGAVTLVEHNESLWPANATLSARVQFLPDREWPSVLFAEVTPQWSNYQQLSFRVVNTQAIPLPLYIRVDNQDSGPESEIRMTVSRTIDPGESVITISLEEFRQQAEKSHPTRPPSMERILSFVLFMRRLEESHTLLFDDVELTSRESALIQ
ncbi:hypothetical protein OAM69_03210 [bacterium]|nr:hypothetical protein [bacterium]